VILVAVDVANHSFGGGDFAVVNSGRMVRACEPGRIHVTMSPRRRDIDASAFLQHGTMLHDRVAHEWFAQREQRVESSASFRVFADTARGGGLALARIWHTAATIHRQPGSGKGLTVLIQIEGDARLDVADTSTVMALVPGAAALIPDGLPYSLSTDAATARVEIRLRHSLGLLADGKAVTWAEHPYIRVLLATVNAALSAPAVDPAAAGFAHLKSAIRSILFARASAVPLAANEKLRGSEAVLFQRAQAVIERDSVKPDFQVADLASQLRVSQVYLRRVFAHAGTTPLKVIRDTRVRNALVHLQHAHNPRPRHELERIARSVGFSSVRRMKETLATWEEHQQDTPQYDCAFPR